VGRKTHKPGSSGWVQVVVALAIAYTATTGAGHSVVSTPRPPTVCTQLRVS
jgi:hypothetical protein